MFSNKYFFALVFVLLIAMPLHAQKIEDWNPKAIDTTLYNAFDVSKNTLENNNSIYPLLAKLYKIKHFSKENAVFVHIGDSHIQGDVALSLIHI